MNFKKFILKKRFLIISLLLIATPGIIFAVQNLQSYDITAGVIAKAIWPRQSDNVSVANTAVCVDNTAGGGSSHTYFVGNKTQKEVQSFFTNLPYGVALSTGCCVDGICSAGETCSNCASDCGACSSPCGGNFTDSRDGQVYPMVQLSDQCWMGKNINIGTMISYYPTYNYQGNFADGIQKYCWGNTAAGCSTYGGLYQWHMAMGLPSVWVGVGFIAGGTTPVVTIPERNQGICPTGWHMPSESEINTMISRLGGYNVAGTKLITVSGWSQAGTDVFGFSALPGNFVNDFTTDVGCSKSGFFWSATTTTQYTNPKTLKVCGSSSAYLDNSATSGWQGGFSRTTGVSVRCIRDAAAAQLSLSYIAGSNGSLSGNTSQWLDYGKSGTTVTPAPNVGYVFKDWSDGSTANPRTDTNVTSNISVTANFVPCGTITIAGAGGLTYGMVLGADGKCWLDRNLGATRVAQSSSDSVSFGYQYQWGRGSDGHQVRGSAITTTLSTTDTPGHGNFIKNTNNLGDQNWRSSINDNLWQGVSGVNNPCPSGFRVPTSAEWQTWITAAGISNVTNAYNSTLKLPAGGMRDELHGLTATGAIDYWSSTPSNPFANEMWFGDVTGGLDGVRRQVGLSVRCIRN